VVADGDRFCLELEYLLLTATLASAVTA
jgi:hypothetical protein